MHWKLIRSSIGYDLDTCRDSGRATPECAGDSGVQSSMRIVAIFVRLTLIAVLLTGIAWNVRAAIADRLASRNQPVALRQAMRLDPENPEYPAQLAWQLQVADPRTAESLFERAVRLNPDDASAWISLGLLDEERGALVQAETNLLHAAAVDVTWLPSWSLANFYFRRQRWEEFWSWAEKAAQMVPDDATPLLRLAWYVAPSEPEIQNRLRIGRPEVQRQFLWFLIAQGDASAVAEWGNRALTSDVDSGEDVLSACDWLMAQKRPDLALPLWNGLAARHQIPFSPLSPGAGDAVTNGDFARQPLSRGFDWRLTNPDGVGAFLNTNPSALGFEFSGRESESILLLSEVVPVLPEKPYTLSIDSASSEISPDSGLQLLASDAGSGEVLAQVPGSSGRDLPSQVCFITTQSTSFLSLMLEYQRQPGTVPIEGRVEVRKIGLLPGATAACGTLPPPGNLRTPPALSTGSKSG